MNKEQALQAFNDYVSNYDEKNVRIALKIAHTFRVAEISERIAVSIDRNEKINPEFSWLLGLLHDIGRFEQVTRYGTFKDVLSLDHAELGADILFNEGLIKNFPCEGIEGDWLKISETAIRVHNKLKVPEGLDRKTEIYSNILRDADKADIFRVFSEPPYDKQELENLTVRDEILSCVREHRCVQRASVEINALEYLVVLCCMAFEIVFPETKRIILGQGYLGRLISRIEDDCVRGEFEDLLRSWPRAGVAGKSS